MTNTFKQNFNKSLVGAFIILAFAMVFSLNIKAVHAQYDDGSDYTSYDSGSDYTSYTPSSDYTSYTPSSNYTSYTPSSDYTSYTPSSNYTSYTPASDYTSYTPASDYTSYTPASDYTSYTQASDYTSYTPASDYTSYTPASDYTSYTPASDYTSYTPGSDYTSYTPASDYTSYTPASDYTSYNSSNTNYQTTAYNTPSYSYNTPSYSFSGGYNFGVATNYGTSCGGSCYHQPQPTCNSNCYPQPQPQPHPQPLPPPPPPALNGSCSANTSNANVGNTITWSVNSVSGGIGNYTYSWSGTDGLSGSGSSVSRSYGYAGTKSASVTIYSDGQSITRNCSTYINTPYVPPTPPPYIPPVYPPVYPPIVHNHLDASCTANQSSGFVGDNVTWSVTNVSGSVNGFTYSWSGTDGLYGSGQYVTRAYNYPGTKFAYLTVYSGGQTITRTCSLYINGVSPIVAYAQPIQPIYTGVNGVSLTQVPYTGLDSNMKVILFTLALVAWSTIVTYIVIIRKRNGKLALATVSTPGISEVDGGQVEQSEIQNSLMSHDNLLGHLEGFARNQNVIISSDALEAVSEHAGHDQKRAETLLSSLANRHSNGKDSTIIDLNKVKSAIG